MLRAFILHRLDVAERKIGVSVEYLRHIARVSPRSFFKFAKYFGLVRYRRALPLEALCVAQLAAVRCEDCGSCVQGHANLARQEGVSAEILRAAIEARPDDLPKPLADVYRFSEAVCLRTAGEDELRERIVAHFGDKGLVELAMGIAAARVFPTTKRALGYAVSCEPVTLEA